MVYTALRRNRNEHGLYGSSFTVRCLPALPSYVTAVKDKGHIIQGTWELGDGRMEGKRDEEQEKLGGEKGMEGRMEERGMKRGERVGRCVAEQM